MNNIVIKDGQATPVGHTFVPYSTQTSKDAPAVWYERSGATPLGWRRITLSVITVVNGISKVRIVISDPVLAQVNSNCCVDQKTPLVSYTDFANISFSIPFQASVENRKDILSYAKNLLGDAVITSAVVDLQPQL